MSEYNKLMQNKITELTAPDAAIRVLEAGCGSASRLDFGRNVKITGIDISERQLERNTQLDKKICGDIQQVDLTGGEFDYVVSWDVLEHLNTPKKAIDNFFTGLRTNGYMVLALPNLYSLKGLVTKFTPFSVHRWFYRHIVGDKRATEELEQFPTYLRHSVSPGALRRYVRSRGMQIVFFKKYEGPVQTHLRKKSVVFRVTFGLITVVSRIFSLGALNLNHSDYFIIAKKL